MSKTLAKKSIDEIGNAFYRAFHNGVGSVEDLTQRGLYGVPPVISNLFVEAGLKAFHKFPTVFLIGRVYKEEVSLNTRMKGYRRFDPWREEAKKAILKAGLIPLDGISFDLHNEDVVAGAGRAFFHAYISPLGIVDGRGRVGMGSLEEAKFILHMGGNIGFIVKRNEYEDVVSYLKGKSKAYPSSLPAYFGLLDLESSDIINGIEDLQDWVKAQRKKLRYKSFAEREIPRKLKTIIDYYALFYARYRGEDIRMYEKILEQVRY